MKILPREIDNYLHGNLRNYIFLIHSVKTALSEQRMKFRFLYKVENFLSRWKIISFKKHSDLWNYLPIIYMCFASLICIIYLQMTINSVEAVFEISCLESLLPPYLSKFTCRWTVSVTRTCAAAAQWSCLLVIFSTTCIILPAEYRNRKVVM